MRAPRLDVGMEADATVRDPDRTIPDGPSPSGPSRGGPSQGGPRPRGLAISLGVAALLVLVPLVLPLVWSARAASRLQSAEAAPPDPSQQLAVAAEADEAYCNGSLKQVLRRVLTSCGLLGGAAGRGCQPADARQVATMAGGDFNALFLPMKERGVILQFERASAGLDPASQQLASQVFADRRGASYFLVVARASPDGPEQVNRDLSRQRAEGVLAHLQSTFPADELEGRVGMLWLGEEFAQLDPSFCEWSRSGGAQCRPEDLNRSAFVAWIDCTL
ncbi:MAG: hypothetical protein R3B99_30020 [Polyangiales bacterium]